MSSENDFISAVSTLKIDSDLWHAIIHGGPDQDVTTESGVVPSFAKFLTQIKFDAEKVLESGWDVSSNTPDLSSLTPDEYDYYIVLVGGTSSITGTSTTWEPGDEAFYIGGNWYRIPKRSDLGVNSVVQTDAEIETLVPSYIGQLLVSVESPGKIWQAVSTSSGGFSEIQLGGGIDHLLESGMSSPENSQILFEYSAGDSLESIPNFTGSEEVLADSEGIHFNGNGHISFKSPEFPNQFAHGLTIEIEATFWTTASPQGLIGCANSSGDTRVDYVVGGDILESTDTLRRRDNEIAFYIRGDNLSYNTSQRWSNFTSGRRRVKLKTRSNFSTSDGDVSVLTVDGEVQPDPTLIAGSVFSIEPLENDVYIGTLVDDAGSPKPGTGFVGVIHSIKIYSNPNIDPVTNVNVIAERAYGEFPAWGLPVGCGSDTGARIVMCEEKVSSLSDAGYVRGVAFISQTKNGPFSEKITIMDDPAYKFHNFALWRGADRWYYICSRFGSQDDETELRNGTNEVDTECLLGWIKPDGTYSEPSIIPTLTHNLQPGPFSLPSPSKAVVITSGTHAGRVVVPFWGYASSSSTSDQAVLAYSDDNGTTWTFGTPTGGSSRVNEASIALMPDGETIMASLRCSSESQRYLSYSTDGGVSLSAPVRERNLRGTVVHCGLEIIGNTAYFSGPTYLQTGNGVRRGMAVRTAEILTVDGANSEIDYSDIHYVREMDGVLCGYSNVYGNKDELNLVFERTNGNEVASSSFGFRQSLGEIAFKKVRDIAVNTMSERTDFAVPPRAEQGDLGGDIGGGLLRMHLQPGVNEEYDSVGVLTLGSPIDTVTSIGDESSSAVFTGEAALVPDESAHGIAYRGQLVCSNPQSPDQYRWIVGIVINVQPKEHIHYQFGNATSAANGHSIYTTADGRIVVRGRSGGSSYAMHLPNAPTGLAVVTLDLDRLTSSAGVIRGYLNNSDTGWLVGDGGGAITSDVVPNANGGRSGSFYVRDISGLAVVKVGTNTHLGEIYSELQRHLPS